jgi:ribosome biogenesis GTPase
VAGLQGVLLAPWVAEEYHGIEAGSRLTFGPEACKLDASYDCLKPDPTFRGFDYRQHRGRSTSSCLGWSDPKIPLATLEILPSNASRKGLQTMCDRVSSGDFVSPLPSFGFTPSLERAFQAIVARRSGGDLEPGRVIFASREIYRVMTEAGEVDARVAGKLRRDDGLPVVGDWVALQRSGGAAVLQEILPRRSSLSRKVPGEVTREQVVATNIDTVFLVMGLDGDFNLRRFERLAVMAWESGAQPVGVLTKADLHGDPAAARLDAQMVLPGAPVHYVSSLTREGLEALRPFLVEASTVSLIGSSGAGKSTLINALCGEEIMRTAAVRPSDQRGRHTTNHRQLVQLPGGGLLVDNPGIREIQLWADDEALAEAFDDIAGLSNDCRFRDCRHEGEPGCAVQLAVEKGDLSPSRLANWRALEKELLHLERRRDVASQRREDRRLGRFYKRVLSQKPNRRGS